MVANASPVVCATCEREMNHHAEKLVHPTGSADDGYLDPILGGGVKEVAPFVALVIILMLRPYGLFGKVEIERV